MIKFNSTVTKITDAESMMEFSSYDEAIDAINKVAMTAKIAELTGTKNDKFEDRLKFHEVHLNPEANEYNIEIKDTQENKEREYIEYVIFRKHLAEGWSFWENHIYKSALTNVYEAAKIIYNEVISPFGALGWHPCDIKCVVLNDNAYVFDVAYAHNRTKDLYNIDRFNITLYADRWYGHKKYGAVYRHDIKTLEHELKKIIVKNLNFSKERFPEHWVEWENTPVNTDIISMRNRYNKYMRGIYKKDNIKTEKVIVADIGKGKYVPPKMCTCLNKSTLRQIANHIDIDSFIKIPRSSRGMVKIIPDENSNPFTNKPTVTLHMNTKKNVDNLLCEYTDILRGFSIITFMKSRQHVHKVRPYYGNTTYVDYISDLVSIDKTDNDTVLTFEITFIN